MNNNKLINKYKIKKVNNLFYNDLILNKLNNILNDIDNLILLGDCGSGKTSVINIIKKKYKVHLQLSNFNSKGYDFIMNSINNFIKIKEDDIKLLIFDNLDNLSIKAQHIISEVLNEYNVKVIISCIDICNIIESIQSNCIIVKLLIEKEILFENLEKICKKEEFEYDNNALNLLIDTYNYDIRKIINIMDIINLSFNKITVENINKLLNKIDNIKINNILTNILNNRDLKNSIILSNELLLNGYSREDILLAYIDELNIMNIDEELKINLINIINKKYIIINEVINSNLQLYSCLSELLKFNITFRKEK